MTGDRDRDCVRAGGARLLTGVAWVVLLLGLWLWGRGATGGSGTTTGDVAAAGRPPAPGLPAAHGPLPAARPQQVVIESVGIRAPVVGRGPDAAGAAGPPSYGRPGEVGWYRPGAAGSHRPGEVGWYRAGPQPGAVGVAVLVGQAQPPSRPAVLGRLPAVFHRLGEVKPGQKVRVGRADGSAAEFTVEQVEVVGAARFEAERVYGPRKAGRAELRLLTCGGRFDRTRGTCTLDVVVSAYLTGVHQDAAAPASVGASAAASGGTADRGGGR
ncbi:sortase domain-containing protein [Streptomyces sp. P1-3]|uniref:sortase domain-containing protein n=1 Tax=Streptomyces sp. P1-3 TaxID=3421658 RepID=UPI003D35F7F0